MMNRDISEKEFELFRGYISTQCGIEIEPEKAYLIETRLSRILAESQLPSFEALYSHIMSSGDKDMSERIIDAITTNETLWFRDASPWKVMGEVCLPYYVAQLRSGAKKTVQIWSAACSTGQEPYSIAMCIDQYLARNGIQDVTLAQFEIVATDISKTAIDIARRGRYDAISIRRGLDTATRDQYFESVGAAWQICERIQKRVRFERLNLQNDTSRLGKFDIVFCRYVLIYFSMALKRDLVGRIHQILANDGFLFTGNYLIYDLFEGLFDMAHHENAVYFTKLKGERA